MERILEEEVIDDHEQIEAYVKADFSDSNQLFVDEFISYSPKKYLTILDIGCGPGYIPVLIVKKYSNCKIYALDASSTMLSYAKMAITNSLFNSNIELIHSKIQNYEPNQEIDVIISKDFLHHLPDPMILWSFIGCCIKKSSKDLFIYVMDLFRPETPEIARQIVEKVSKNEPDILKSDFYNSLLAAFTVEEIKNHLVTAGLHLSVEKVSERHLVIKGLLKAKNKNEIV